MDFAEKMEDIVNVQTFCHHCNKKTKFEDEQYIWKKNGKLQIKGYCSKCTNKKSCFIDKYFE